MPGNSVTVEVDVKLTVSRDTAETCLKLVEMFLNENNQYDLFDSTKEDGSRVLLIIGSGRGKYE